MKASGANKAGPSAESTTETNASAKHRKKRRQVQVDPNAPKRPPHAYRFYFKEYHAEHSGCSFPVLSQQCGQAWKQLTDTQKQPYIDQATEALTEYEKVLSAYKKTDNYKKFLASSKADGKSGSKSGKRPGDISVFSEQFIQYNQARNSELRNVRNRVAQLTDEQQSLQSRLTQLQSAAHDFDDRRQHLQSLTHSLRAHRGRVVSALVKHPAAQGVPKTKSSSLSSLLRAVEQKASAKAPLASIKLPPIKLS